MSLQQGRGAGVSGVIDMAVTGIPGGSLTYACRVYGWDWKIALQPIDRTGRTGVPNFRLGDFKGRGTAEGLVQTSGFPYPDVPKYGRGTLTLQQMADDAGSVSCGVSFPIRIHAMELGRDDERKPKAEDLWSNALSWVMDGAAVITWNGTQVTFSAPTLNFSETLVGIQKTYDPYGLHDRASQRIDAEGVTNNDTSEFAMLISYIASAVSPGQSLKVVTTTYQKTDSAGGHFIVSWARRSTSDDTLFPHVMSSRASETPFLDHTSAILTHTSNAATLANILWNGTSSGNGFQSVAFAKGLVVTPLVDGKFLAVYEYRNPGATVSGTSRSGGRLVEAIVNGTSAQLYVVSNLSYGTGRRRIILSRRRVFGSVVRRFVLFRQLTGTTIPDQSPTTINGVTLPLIGATNNATFLGLAAGTVLYQGPKYKVNIGLASSGNFPIAIGYEFHSDSLGIVDNVPQNVFIRDTVGLINDTNTAPHYQDSTVLGYSGITIPTQGSFGAFISGI
jgi:hypothetical protein